MPVYYTLIQCLLTEKFLFLIETYSNNKRGNLTHFNPIFHFHTPSKRQETFDFLIFSGGIEMENWIKMDYILSSKQKLNGQQPLFLITLKPVN